MFSIFQALNTEGQSDALASSPSPRSPAVLAALHVEAIATIRMPAERLFVAVSVEQTNTMSESFQIKHPRMLAKRALAMLSKRVGHFRTQGRITKS